MKMKEVREIFAAMLTVLAIPAAAIACGGYGGFQPYLIAEGEFEGSIVQGENLIAINPDGALISTNMNWGTTRDYGRFDRELLPHIDVSGDRVCVATETEICEISLKSGKIMRVHPHTQGKCGAVMVGEHQIFLNNGTSIAIMDMTDGTTLRKINLMPKGKAYRTGAGATVSIHHARVGDRLYIVRPNTRGLAVVDLKRGRRLHDVHNLTSAMPSDIIHSDGTLFIIERTTSCGLQQERLTTINAVTGSVRTSSPLEALCEKLPATQSFSPSEIIGTYRDGILVSVDQRLRFFNSKGVLVR